MSHACPIRGCEREARDGHVMCFECWALVPKVLQATIWRLWREGRPAEGHREAVENAINQGNARGASKRSAPACGRGTARSSAASRR